MKIVHARPPMFDEIHAVFPMASKPGVIFTWGSTIYVPDGSYVSPQLRAHEGVHYQRQTDDTAKIEAWWQRYLIDVEFRLAEEVPAHRAEYFNFCATNADRNRRSRVLHTIADRLAGPLYGGLLKPAAARILIGNR